MKRKVVHTILAFVLTVSMVSGCGESSAAVEDTSVTEEAEDTEEIEEPAEKEEAEEPEEELVEVEYSLVITGQQDDGTFEGYDTDHRYVITLSDSMEEEQKALFSDGAALKVTVLAAAESQEESGEEVSEEEEVSGTEEADLEEKEDSSEEEPIYITAEKAETIEESEAYTLSQAVSEKVNGYSIEDMADTSMFAKSSVNVRKGPSTDNDQVGSLSTGQEVTVTGLTSTNWYRINYNGTEAYVSGKYLLNEKPQVQTASSSAAGSGSSSGGSSSGGSSSAGEPTLADAYLVYSSEAMDAAYAEGDMATYNAMLQANVDAYDAKFGTTWGSASAQAPTSGGGSNSGSGSSSGGSSSSEKSTYTSREFADYLNQKREEEGLNTLSWSDSLASTALERAEEIVDDYSHNGMRNCGGENLYKTTSSSVEEWFNAFYNSSGHRINMMSENKRSVGAAVCHSGSYYYVVVLFDY